MAPPNPTPIPSRRSAHLALAAFLVVMLGLLAFRGYGTRLAARPTDSAASRIDLSRADRVELEQLPAVGPKRAKAIEELNRGPLRAADDLRAVHGFGPKTVEKVRPFVSEPPEEPLLLERKPPAPTPRAASGSVRKVQPGDAPIDVNAASAEELMRLPGVGAVTAQNIIAAREARPFTSANDLDRVKGIGPKTLEKLRPFVVVK